MKTARLSWAKSHSHGYLTAFVKQPFEAENEWMRDVELHLSILCVQLQPLQRHIQELAQTWNLRLKKTVFHVKCVAVGIVYANIELVVSMRFYFTRVTSQI